MDENGIFKLLLIHVIVNIETYSILIFNRLMLHLNITRAFYIIKTFQHIDLLHLI